MSEKIYLTEADKSRIRAYTVNEELFDGEHFNAFSIEAKDAKWSREYQKLRYIVVNFAGLISKVSADMLFGEPISIKAKDKANQKFIDAVVGKTKLITGLYESALSNSYHGDAVFHIRSYMKGNKKELVLAPFHPSLYFPKINNLDLRQAPNEVEKKIPLEVRGKKAVYIERQTIGKINYELWSLAENKLETQLSLSDIGITTSEFLTNVDELLIHHVKNYGKVGVHWGLSDYRDLHSCFHELNHRMTAIEVVLDTFGDPILFGPKGILDENGQFVKSRVQVIEADDAELPEPKYITWDANLEYAFKEIDKLVEFLYMMSATSPDVLGMGQGQADTGRALKYRLLRTIAKIKRKKLYYHVELPEIMYKVMLFCKNNNIEVDGEKVSTPERPLIEWQDGLPIDTGEILEQEEKAIDIGVTTRKDASKRVYNIDDKEAERIQKDRKDETGISLPQQKVNPIPGQPPQPPQK